MKLTAHIRAIRQTVGFETARIVFCPESNLASEGKRITKDLRDARVENLFCLREDTQNGEGIRTTNALKKEMWIMMNSLLNRRGVRWHKRMACVGNVSSDEDEKLYDASSMRKLVIDELASYQRKLEPSSDRDKMPTEIFTGKMTGPDDHGIAVQICLKSIDVWKSNQDFYGQCKPIYLGASMVA